MYDMENVQGDAGGSLQDRLERFVGLYVSRYRRIVDMANLSSENLPVFYLSFPFKVQVHLFDNGTIGIFFMKGDEATIISLEKGEFHEARWILEDKACERFIGLRNADEATPERADVMAEKDAERDTGMARKKQALTDMKSELGALQGDITDMAKVNPWLEERAAGQIGRVSATRTVIENLEREVGEDRYNLFKEYMSNFDLLELQLPEESPLDQQSPPSTIYDYEDDRIPTLSTIAIEDAELDEPFIEPEPRGAMPRKKKPTRPAAPTPQKTQKPLVPPRDSTRTAPTPQATNIAPPQEVTPEVKNTVFRMNRRLFTLEKKVEELEVLKPSEMKKLRKEFQELSKEQKALKSRLKKDIIEQNARIKASSDAITNVVSEEVRKIRKFAIGMGMLAIIFSLLALFFALSAMGYV